VLAFGIIENGRSWLFSTKMRVVWPLIIDERLIHLSTHMFPYQRSYSSIFGGDHCWGPSASEDPQKRDLTMFSKYASRYLRNQVADIQKHGQDEV
jgi:hypothetical protein